MIREGWNGNKMDSKDKSLMELASKSYKHGLLRLVCYGE